MVAICTMDKYTLKASLTETFKGIIWKVETDGNNPIVAIETRTIADRITHYSAFNYETGECLFKEITVEDSWFWSLDKVHNGIVFLHGYIHESNPEHKGIIALNSDGNIKWQQFNQTLYDITDQGLLVYNPKIQPKIVELISVESGASLPLPQNHITISRNIIIPDIVMDLSLFSHLIPQDIHGPVFYKKVNNKDILVYHLKTKDLFTQQLTVYQDGSLLLEDILAADIQKLNPEAFFIEHNHLFYIRNNKREFVSYLV